MGILGMRFSRTAEIVTISLDVRLPPRVYKTDRRTLTTSVLAAQLDLVAWPDPERDDLQ